MTDNLTELNSRIDRIEVTLTHVVDTIEKMARVVNKPQETKWGPILTALTLLFLAAGGYTTLITQPIQREADVMRTEMNEMTGRELKRERDLGRIEGKLGLNLDE